MQREEASGYLEGQQGREWVFIVTQNSWRSTVEHSNGMGRQIGACLDWLHLAASALNSLERREGGRSNSSSHWTEWLTSTLSEPNLYPKIYLNYLHAFAMLTNGPSKSFMCLMGKYMKTHKPMDEIICLLAFLSEWLVLYRDTGNTHCCGSFRKHNLLSWNLSLPVRYARGQESN